MGEAADGFEIFRSRAPSFRAVAGSASEAAVVVRDEALQHGVGGVDVGSLSQAKFTGQAVLQHAPEAFDAAFGLRALGGDESDAELLESPAELSGLALASELFVERPVIIVAGEDAAAITIEGDGNAVAAQEALEKVEIALGGFRWEELSGKDFPGSIVLHAQGGEQRAAAFEP